MHVILEKEIGEWKIKNRNIEHGDSKLKNGKWNMQWEEHGKVNMENKNGDERNKWNKKNGNPK